MANFDTNLWYQICLSSGTTQSLDGSVLYDAGKGATFFKDTNTSSTEQQWQFYPVNSSYYVLRTRASGARGYLNAAFSVNETTPGRTVPDMRNSTLSDDSMYWQVGPWEDGSYYLTNKANGTDWHLAVKSNSLMAMTSNISSEGARPGQKFVFKGLTAINNKAFSSVVTPTATGTAVTSTSTSITTGTGTGPTATQPPSNGSSGLSTGAKAGIGAGIGVVVLIALLVLGFFIMKRRKRRNDMPQKDFIPVQQDMRPPEKQPYGDEMYGNSTETSAPAELGGHQRQAELEVSTPPVELPAYGR